MLSIHNSSSSLQFHIWFIRSSCVSVKNSSDWWSKWATWVYNCTVIVITGYQQIDQCSKSVREFSQCCSRSAVWAHFEPDSFKVGDALHVPLLTTTISPWWKLVLTVCLHLEYINLYKQLSALLKFTKITKCNLLSALIPDVLVEMCRPDCVLKMRLWVCWMIRFSLEF